MAESLSPSSSLSSVDVKDKVVLVTGSNRGLGKAFVEVFVKAGARKVYAAARNIKNAERAFFTKSDSSSSSSSSGNDDDGITNNNYKSTIVPLHLDLSDPESIQKAAEENATDVQIVINNAGVLSRTSPLETNAIESLKEEMSINVYGLIYLAQAFTPVLERNNKDQAATTTAFVQVNSVSSMRCAAPEVCTYSASKAASYTVTQALRQTLVSKGIKVLSVHPGPIATEMIATASEEFIKLAASPHAVAEEVIAALNSSDGNFLVYPDPNSKKLGQVYSLFSKDYIEGGKLY